MPAGFGSNIDMDSMSDEELIAYVASMDPGEAERQFQQARELSIKASRESYTAWCEEVGRERGWAPAKHHRVIMKAVEETITGKGPNRLLITAPPGSAKSTYTSELLPGHLLSRTPAFNLIGTSNTSTLAEDFSERTLALIDTRPDLVPFRIRKRSAALWTTTMRGRYRAAGVGVGIQGNRADGVLIDDAVKSREQADSETMREKLWNWFIVDLRTRLKPNAWVIHITCMVGGTPVRMADGSERPLRDIRVGDRVATYENGALSSSTVANMASQGPDDIFEITTESGAKVRANRRHPFLVCRGRVTRWVRLRHLRPGDQLVRYSCQNGESGEASRAGQKDAKNRPGVKGSACLTITKLDGRRAFGPQASTRVPAVLPGLSTGTAWSRGSMNACSMLREAAARFVESPRLRQTRGLIGAASSAWTTITSPARSVASFVTRATSWLGIAESAPRCSETPPRTSDFSLDKIRSVTPCGREEVFDVQIDRTENFLADGLVSHNTRWHEDDLAGRLIARQPSMWRVLNIPAQATGDEPDPLGRKPGEWLWEDDDYGYGGALKLIKAEYEAAGAMRDWEALFQGKPTAGDGTIFKVHKLEVLETAPAKTVNIVRAWDLAATKKMGTADPDWTVGVKMMRTPEDRYVVLDVVRLRGGPDEVEAAIVNTAKLDGRGVKVGLPQDPGGAGKFVVENLTKKLAGYRVESSPETGDKATRAGPAAAQCNVGNMGMVQASWNAPLRSELAAFPSGTHDDQVDALSRAFSMIALHRPLVVSNEALKDLKYGLRQFRKPVR